MNMRKAKLALAVAAYLAVACYIPDAEAMTTSRVDYDGKPLFEIYYYGAEDAGNVAAKSYFNAFSTEKGIESLVYTLKDDIKTGLDNAFRQWAEILGPGAKNKNPVQYFVGTNNRENASASSLSTTYGERSENPNHLHDALQNGADIEWIESLESLMDESALPPAACGFGGIIIGQNLGLNENDGRYGFVATPIPKPVPTEMRGSPIIPVMFHEIGHSLGILCGRTQKILFPDYAPYQFGDAAENADSFTSHLYDQNGRRADHAGLWIMTSQAYEAIMNSDIPDAVAAVKGNAFIVDDVTGLSGRNGRAYLTFRGDHVTEVLNGRTFADPNGNQVSGLPINLWEHNIPDFSHIDLERSLMSHQNYRSYNTFMEAELALLQDIGYNIDRKNFYGRSIYNNGQTLTNTQGFSARNAEGTAYVDGYNTSTYGVGLHIYGSNNNITQAGNIYTKGGAAAGIRVDGVNNTVTVAKGTEIHSDGTFGAGVLAAYGKNHTIHIDGIVTAKGDGGVGVWADFGANSLGATMEYRGSYIRYCRLLTNGNIDKTFNLGLRLPVDDFSFSDLANGDLNDKMATINVTGTIEAADSAIYIGEGSFVDNINLNEGAKLKGNITNRWKKFSTDMGIPDSDTDTVEEDKLPPGVTIYRGGLMLQYKGQFIPYKKYVPDLVTNLNFNADMSYDGNIHGDSNTKMNVNNGTLLYTGNANVVNVTVAKNAALYGGNYTVNDMTDAMAGGFSDDTTGQFRNHGTIGAADKDSSLTIKGSEGNNAMLISDGRLVAVGGGSKGNIEVAGSANLEGSTVRAFRYLPDETGTVVTATGGITGNAGAEVLGMMNTEIKLADGNNLTLATAEANNLGNATDEQNEMFRAMSAMRKKLQSEGDTARLDEMRALYSLDPAAAKSTLSDIGSSDAADMAAMVQQSSVSSQIIDDRLSTAFAQKTVNLSLPASHLMDAKEENDKALTIPVKLPVEAENDLWVKFTKNWGDTKGGANYHANAISGGYDRAIHKNWRLGGYISYNEMSLGNKNSGGSAYDTRAGVYALYHKNASDAYIYANAGWIRNKHYRGLPALGLSGEGKNGGHIYELGGEYKQDLNSGKKVWSVSPYINFQLSHLRQDGYGETGLGNYNHQVNSLNNTYFAGGLGVEFKQRVGLGSYGARIGVKHAFSGADPNLAYGFEGDASNRYTIRGQQDSTHSVLRLFGETEFTPGWQIAGDTLWQKGAHDRNLSASIMLRRVW